MLNLSLATVSFFIIVVGAVSGFYPIAVLGVIILIGSLLAPSRPPAPRRQPVPTGRGVFQSRVEPPRTASPQLARPQAKLEPMPQPSSETMFPVSSNQGYASNMALFPAAMFPSSSPITMPAQTQAQKQPSEKAEPRDEVIELAAIVVFLRLLSG